MGGRAPRIPFSCKNPRSVSTLFGRLGVGREGAQGAFHHAAARTPVSTNAVSRRAAVGSLSASAAAFGGALLASSLVFGYAYWGNGFTSLRFALTGAAMAYAYVALASLVIVQSNRPNAARSVLFWTLGSLNTATWSILLIPAITVLMATGLVMCPGRQLNAMAVGDETALGVAVKSEPIEAHAVDARRGSTARVAD